MRVFNEKQETKTNIKNYQKIKQVCRSITLNIRNTRTSLLKNDKENIKVNL